MKKIAALLLMLSMLLTLTACGDEGIAADNPEANVLEDYDIIGGNADAHTEWAVYWYLCGSDLETNFGAATNDLAEMMDVSLPDNVQVVIQTGGADMWQNEIIDPDKAQRYLYDSGGLTLLEESDAVNMGEAQTLADFLTFAKENYPAKHTMVTFWNHGGGSVAGAAFDESFGFDSLSLAEMYEAFTSVYEENAKDQPIDIVGFDTCLMATVDTAFTFSDLGKYLVASEEWEPGNGWFYSGWLGALADNPQMEAEELAKVICDTYEEGCALAGTENNITLSVTNLSKVEPLLDAYEAFGREALANAVENPAFFTHFS